MKKFKHIVVTIVLALMAFVTFVGCKTKEFSNLEVEYNGASLDYDNVHNVLMVEYGTNLNLSKEDFSVYVVYKDQSKTKISDFEIDASAVNSKNLSVQDYHVYFSYKDYDYRFDLTVRVYDKEVQKPTFNAYETTYSGEEIDVSDYIESLEGFNSSYMELDQNSTLKATNAGEYTATIKLKDGFVWNTQTAKDANIDFIWKINKKIIETPTLSSGTTLVFKHNQDFEGQAQSLVFEQNQNLKYLDYENITNTNVGDYSATVKIKDSYAQNIEFEQNRSQYVIDYQIVPKAVKVPALADQGEYEYTGSLIEPNISNFESKLMEKNLPQNSINANDYVLEIGFKQDKKANFVWETLQTNNNVSIDYKITKKILQLPTLTSQNYEYTGQIITPTFNNLQENYLEIKNNPNAVNVGTHAITVGLKTSLNANNFAFASSNQVSDVTYNFTITKRNIVTSLSWNEIENAVYNASNFSTTMDITSSINIDVSYSYFVKQGETFVACEQTKDAGQYRVVATLDFDSINNKLVLAGGREISESDLRYEFSVSKADIDCSGITWNISQATYSSNEVLPIVQNLPTNVSVKGYKYFKNEQETSPIDAGNYEAQVELSYDSKNYNLKNFNSKFTFTILPKTIVAQDFSWNYEQAFVYDGLDHTVTLSCEYDVVNISYQNNTASEIGKHKAIATVTVSNSNYTLAENATTFECEFEIVKGAPVLSLTYGETNFVYDKIGLNVETSFTKTGDKTYTAKLIQEGITSLSSITFDVETKDNTNLSVAPNDGKLVLGVNTNEQTGIMFVTVSLKAESLQFVIELYEPAPLKMTIAGQEFSIAVGQEWQDLNNKQIYSDIIVNEEDLSLNLNISKDKIITSEGQCSVQALFTYRDNLVFQDNKYIIATEELFEMPTENCIIPSELEGLSATLELTIVDDQIVIYVSTWGEIYDETSSLVEYATITINLI